LNLETTIQEREAEFWDAVIEKDGGDMSGFPVSPDDLFDRTMPWLDYMDMPAFVSEVFDTVAPAPGRRVLDLGCGKGHLALALAHRGWDVSAIDISPKSIEMSQARAAVSGLAGKVDFQVMDCEVLDFPDNHFDAVTGSFVLHHLNLPKIGKEISRVLKPTGRAACIETIGMNPLLMLARATLPGRFGIEKASSDDEAPLDQPRIDIISQNFAGKVSVAFPKVVFFRMACYLPFMNHVVGRGLLKGLDRLVGAIPPLRRTSYYGVVKLESRG